MHPHLLGGRGWVIVYFFLWGEVDEDLEARSVMASSWETKSLASFSSRSRLFPVGDRVLGRSKCVLEGGNTYTNNQEHNKTNNTVIHTG